MMKRKSNFTLIELIVVIVVLGILAAIVLPNIQSFRKKANEKAKIADLRNIQTAVDMYRAEADDLNGIGFVDTDGNGTNGVAGKVVEVGTKKFALVVTSQLEGEFLRKTPAYLMSVTGTTDEDKKEVATLEDLNVGKGHVVLAVELSKGSAAAAGDAVTLTADDITGKVAYIQKDKIVHD